MFLDFFRCANRNHDDTTIAALDIDCVADVDSDLFPHGARHDQVQGPGPAHEPRGSETEFRLVTHRLPADS